MKKYILLILLFYACNQNTTDLSGQAKNEIIKADIAMSDMASKEGFFKTLLTYATDDVIKPKEGELPVVGKAALTNYWRDKKDVFEITWEPFRAEAAKSGDMGYSIGNWKYVTPDSVYYGNYYTIWKKQEDGKWKFVFDGGNGTPKPLEAK